MIEEAENIFKDQALGYYCRCVVPKSRAKNSKTNSEKERYKISCNLGQLNDQTIGGPLNFTYIKYGDDPTLP